MIQTIAERLAASPHRWLIVTAVTCVLALASALPQVDLLIAERSERSELQAELTQAEASAAQLPVYEREYSAKEQKLERLRQRVVDESQLASLRTWLVDAARQSGCQVRRIDLANPSLRPWSDDENPISPTGPTNKSKATPFQLQTRAVTFSVTGSSNELVALLKAIDVDRRLKHASNIELKPMARNAQELQLELTLWYFALVRTSDVA
ncbi:hypothetical protein Pla108_20210 [Botrimarina colliarenosi]|uniref:Pilus assembly protein, PilO n=1 Tax=Botrimarina colliarenosi TaxID=2528001 RepID=A0A5C6AEM9_9BACT|nr:type 4a pilus biogenesis protein PilO [Botrimarina colliarenosi]TWT97867.1 hypothetical protein Pla108_20210 [Botrimarina colliarenosi]